MRRDKAGDKAGIPCQFRRPPLFSHSIFIPNVGVVRKTQTHDHDIATDVVAVSAAAVAAAAVDADVVAVSAATGYAVAADVVAVSAEL